MSDPDRSSHWKFLADLLGAKPKQEPEVAEAEGLADKAAAHPPAAASPVPPPPAARPKRAAPTGQLPDPQRHWGDVARELGVDVPMVPDEEIQQAPLQEPAQDSPPIVPAAREAVAEPMEESFAAPPEREIPAVSEATDNFLAEVGLVDDTFDALEQETSQSQFADDGPAAREATSRSGPRRRRRGRQRRRPDADDVSPADTRDDEIQPSSEREVDPRERVRERGERGGRERSTEPSERSSEPRRRKRRRGGERRPEESRTGERHGRETRAADDRPSPPRKASKEYDEDAMDELEDLTEIDELDDVGALDETGELDDVDELDDVGELDELDEKSELVARKARRTIPSWQEAIQDIVSHNLAGRQKPRRPRGGRGRRPNQRDR